MRAWPLFLLAAVACSESAPGDDAGGAGAFDAGVFDAGPRSCTYDEDCGAAESGSYCADGWCAKVCAANPTGFACNYGFASDWPPECCGASQNCCAVSFERESCLSTPCPVWCPRGTIETVFGSGTCAADAFCDYARSDQPDGGPPAGECALWTTVSNCVPDCPTERRCGAVECCGEGTICVGGCCTLVGGADAGAM
jgi:hypothetical protein